MGKKTISLRCDEEKLKTIDERAAEADMNRSEYILCCLSDNPVTVFAEGAEIAKILADILLQMDLEDKPLHGIERRLEEICVLLHSLISEPQEGA